MLFFHVTIVDNNRINDLSDPLTKRRSFKLHKLLRWKFVLSLGVADSNSSRCLEIGCLETGTNNSNNYILTREANF